MVEAKRLWRAARRPARTVSVIGKRVEGRLHYQFGSGRAGNPDDVTVHLTRRCNLRCKMCDLWGDAGTMAGRDKPADPDPADVKRLIDSLAPMKPSVLLFGGEPFLYKGFTDILSYVAGKGLRPRIVTNGTLLARHAEDCVRFGMDSVTVSIDGPAEVHDDIRGVPGTFDKLVEGLHALQRAKAEARSLTPTVITLTTISDMNYTALARMVEQLQELPVDRISFQHVMFVDRPALEHHNQVFGRSFGQGSPCWEGFLRTKSAIHDVDRLAREIAEVKPAARKVPVEFLQDFTDDELLRYYTDMRFAARDHCRVPWLSTAVLPNGDVSPCLDYVYGNLRDADFPEIWNSLRARRFRSELKSVGRFPICSRCCGLYRY